MHQRATYQITVPGLMNNQWADREMEISIIHDHETCPIPVTLLMGKFDQAALIGFLRQLYSLGLPIVSVTWIPDTNEKVEK